VRGAGAATVRTHSTATAVTAPAARAHSNAIGGPRARRSSAAAAAVKTTATVANGFMQSMTELRAVLDATTRSFIR
jgi:hypothetical protein